MISDLVISVFLFVFFKKSGLLRYIFQAVVGHHSVRDDAEKCCVVICEILTLIVSVTPPNICI